jgi:hypothetical protein
MGSKIKLTPQRQEAPEKGGFATPPDRPLLDLSDAAIKTLLRAAKKRGYILLFGLQASTSQNSMRPAIVSSPRSSGGASIIWAAVNELKSLAVLPL